MIARKNNPWIWLVALGLTLSAFNTFADTPTVTTPVSSYKPSTHPSEPAAVPSTSLPVAATPAEAVGTEVTGNLPAE